jgi:predicted aspartyl protease
MRVKHESFQGGFRKIVLASLVMCFVGNFVIGEPSDGHAASTALMSEVELFTSPDENSELIEAIRDSGSLVPIAEMIGAGGKKWFMVKSRSGNVGWIMASDTAAAKKVDDHFRALPKEIYSIGPAVTPSSDAPAGTATNSAGGAVTIPIQLHGNSVLVPVSFSNGSSSTTAILVVDTGAGQTVISKRVAHDLGLSAIDSQARLGIGGSVRVDVGVVESMKVGGAELKNLPISIHDFSPDRRFEGLLGLDFLGRFQMSVDTEKQVMVLSPQKKAVAID